MTIHSRVYGKQFSIFSQTDALTINVNKTVKNLSAKIFLLSYIEVVAAPNATLVNTEGAKLAYFSDGVKDTRIANINGTAKQWWTRSPAIANTSSTYEITASGSFTSVGTTRSYGFRPALILPPDLAVDGNGQISVGTLFGYTNIDGINKELTGAHANIGGAWKDISGIYMNIGGTWKEMP